MAKRKTSMNLVSAPKQKKKKKRSVDTYRGKIVNAIVEDSRSMLCAECGSPLRGTIHNYGVTKDGNAFWFIRECTCGIRNKYLSNIMMTEWYPVGNAIIDDEEETATIEPVPTPAPKPAKRVLIKKKKDKPAPVPVKENTKPKKLLKKSKKIEIVSDEFEDLIFDF